METGPVGQPPAPCLHCNTSFLDDSSFCYNCGHPRTATYKVLSVGRLLVSLFIGLFSTAVLSLGGCAIVFGLNERGMASMVPVGLVMVAVGVLTTYKMVRTLKG